MSGKSDIISVDRRIKVCRWLRTSGAILVVFTAAQWMTMGEAASQGAATAPTAPAAAAPAAPAATAPAATAPAAPATTRPAAVKPKPASAGGPAPLIPRPRDKVEQAPDPTPVQLAALRELQREAQLYEAEAKDYRATITRIIRHHYEERRRRILATLDREIAIETQGLRAARADAIKRLEYFVAKYSGPTAHPENTPDAMFRLAALYEERSREIVDELDMAPGQAPPMPDLRDAMALYKRIVREFPQYRELAGVYYYLAHAYNDTARLEEAQQVWRSLVCHNHFRYPVPPDPKDPTKDKILRMPQDHSADWWLGWMQRHPEPPDLARAADGTRTLTDEDAELSDDEDSFKDPYPDSCKAIAQDLEPGQEPRYLAEVWWQIGDYHFEEIDPWGGPYNLNRAESAYQQSMKYKKPPVYGVAMYKLAWTYFKQQRYETAVSQFVELLNYTDAQEELTGNSGADFRAEAYAYIAGSVAYLDFKGPGPNDPYIARNDIFDLESDGAIIEQKMHVAIDRIQDPNLIPQDKKWTVEIYKALANEFREYNHYHNLIEVNELSLQKWPMHRDAPFVQNQIAQTYETLAGQSRGAEHQKYLRKALEARGKLINYVATPGQTSAWVEANKEDPEAIRAAERLVRDGLRRAAADHTNAARRLVDIARKAPDAAQRQLALEKALSEFDMAGKAWGAYLLQDENAEDAYESRFWLAHAYTNVVVIKVELDQMPNGDEVARAQRTAREVRDSNEDNKYLQPAGLMVVRVAQQMVVANYKLFDRTSGSEGFEKRTQLEFVGEGSERKFRADPIPVPMQTLINAFDEYIARVPVEADPYKNHDNFAYTSGEIPFLYGQFVEAKRRLTPIYLTQCGSTKYGYLAWEKLITMANQEGDTERGRQLAEASKKKSCAVDEEQKVKESGISDPTISRGFYVDAAKAYKKAQEMPDGPERDKQWRRAAAMYKEALNKAPDRDEAPEAAMLGASSYKQVGEYDQAIAMYELFIKAYGNEDRLERLQKGDPAKGKPPQMAKYKERVKFLKLAYDELARSYVLFFDYRAAAVTYEKIAKNKRFEQAPRQEAARNAVFLYASIGQSDKMREARAVFNDLKPPAEQSAEVDWLIASASLKAWDERGLDRGSNRDARLKAIRSMDDYYRANVNNRAANAFTVRAAYQSSKLRRAGSDPRYKDWCNKTRSAFDAFKAGAGNNEETGRNKALGSLQADMAAECEYRELDAIIKKKFDYDAGFHRYKGVITEVVDEFKDDVEKKAKAWFDQLQTVITKYESRRWAVAARARQGSRYDSCRTGLYNARPPGLKLFTDKEEKVLKKLDKLCEEQGAEVACTKGDEFRANRRAKWREKRDKFLADADRAMVAGYGESLIWARAWKVQVDAVDKAVRRLAFFTDILGDQKLRDYSGNLKDPATNQAFVYQDGMFLRMRRGLSPEVEPQILVTPLPMNVR